MRSAVTTLIQRSAAVLLAASAVASAQAAGLTDTLDCGSPASEKAHGVTFSGNVTRGMVGDTVGGQETPHPARTVSGRNSALSYRLAVSATEPTTLEIEELYGRDTDVRGYQVLVDGKPVYLRTFQGSGAGPVHYFVQIPPAGKKQITLTLLNHSDTPFSIRRIWAFSDFPRYFDQNRIAVPYHIAPIVALSFSDFAADQTKLRQIRDSLGAQAQVKPAFTAFVPYAQLSARDVEERIDYILRLAETMEMPVQFGFDTWWGSTPGGSDGKGGYWTDVRHQQVVYNATTRQYQLSIPNRWSNTPWLSPSEGDLLSFKERRLRESMSFLRRRRQALQAKGVEDRILAVNLDNEPVYWASGNAGLGSDLLQADFHPSAVEQAKRDGVTLDPTDGLSRPENLWLFRNLLAYNERIGRAAVTGLGRDAVIVRGNSAMPPADNLAANIYTQAMVASGMPQYPMLDFAYPFWETAAPASVRMGGEWNGDSVAEQQAVLHQIALGRAAAVNAEAGQRVEKRRGVHVGYALAQRYYTPYNYPLDKMDVATTDLRDLSKPFPPFVFQPVLLESHFRDDAWKKQAESFGGIKSGLIGGTAAIAVFPESPDRSGFLQYRLTPRDAAFTEGLFLELTGRAFVSQRKDPTVNVRVLAGTAPDPAAMREVIRFHDNGSFGAAERINLSGVAAGQKSVFVRIEMNAPGLSPDVLSWSSVRGVRFTTGWPQSLSRDLPPQDETLETVRRQNLVVSGRRDAERVIADLEQQVRRNPPPAGLSQTENHPRTLLSQARAAYARGAYGTAYRLATQGASVLLPAAFRVEKSGKLQPFPVTVDADAPVTGTVHEWSPARVRLDLQTDEQRPMPVQLRLSRLAPGTRYGLARSGATLVLTRATPAGKADTAALTVDKNGDLVLKTLAEPFRAPAEPSVWRGVFQAHTDATLSFIPEDGSNRKRLPTDARTVVRRGAPKAAPVSAAFTDLRPGDRINAQVGPNGIVTTVTATGQRLQGTVQTFTPLSPYAMATVTLREDSIPRVIHLYSPLHLRSGDTSVRTMPVGAPLLRPGDKVTIQVDPQTGRIHELWQNEQP